MLSIGAREGALYGEKKIVLKNYKKKVERKKKEIKTYESFAKYFVLYIQNIIKT